MRKPVILVICLLLGGVGFTGANRDKGKKMVKALRVEYATIQTVTEVTGESRTTTRRKFVTSTSDGRERTEFVDANGVITSMILFNNNTGEKMHLDLGARIAYRSWVQTDEPLASNNKPVNPAEQGVRHMTESLGSRTIQGMDCEGHGDDFLEFWQCDEPVTGQTIIGLMQTRSHGGLLTESVEKIEVITIDPDVVMEPPGDFQIKQE